MIDKIIQVIENNYTIPKILISNYRNLKIKDSDLVLIIYLMNAKSLLFDPKNIAKDLNIDSKEVLEIIDRLSTEEVLKIELVKVNNVREEYISLDNLYKKLAYQIINVEEVDNKKEQNVFDDFEKEFGRTLSPTEYEIISSWIKSGYSEELIKAALQEAVFNGVSNLRYIDKILYDWNRKNIKTKEDIIRDKEKFQRKKIEKKELFDYDWLNDDE